MRFAPCPSCARHVKASDCTCPFCGVKVACVPAGPAIAGKGMSRAALFAASALGTLAMAASDCTATSQAAYGGFVPLDEDAGLTEDAAPPRGDGSDDAARPADAGEESPGVVALYGGFAPVDAADDGSHRDG